MAERLRSVKNLNTLNQLFVDTVRTSGGNNTKRVLMISCYSAHADNITILTDLEIPKDGVKDKIIVTWILGATHNEAVADGATNR